jgi:hypothetical protein
MNAKLLKKYHKQITSKRSIFSKELCIFLQKRLLQNKTKLPKKLKTLLGMSDCSWFKNRNNRAIYTRYMKGKGGALAAIPELLSLGISYLNKGLALNKKARIENERRKKIRQKQDLLDKRYLDIILRTKKPL